MLHEANGTSKTWRSQSEEDEREEVEQGPLRAHTASRSRIDDSFSFPKPRANWVLQAAPGHAQLEVTHVTSFLKTETSQYALSTPSLHILRFLAWPLSYLHLLPAIRARWRRGVRPPAAHAGPTDMVTSYWPVRSRNGYAHPLLQCPTGGLTPEGGTNRKRLKRRGSSVVRGDLPT